MKKLLGLVFALLLLLVSCSGKGEYENETNKIKEISVDKYLDSVQSGDENISIYLSSKSERVYYLIKKEDSYKMVIDDSFFSGKLLYEEPKKPSGTATTTTTTTTTGYVEIPDVVLEYRLGDSFVLMDGNSIQLSNALDEEGFKKYCADYFNDEFISISNVIRSLMQEALAYGKIIDVVRITNAAVGKGYYIGAEISLSKMLDNHESNDENRSSNYFTFVNNYLTEGEYSIFLNNLLDYTATIFGGPGSLSVVFYVSEDMTTVYPYFTMRNSDTYLFNIVYSYVENK